MTFAQLQQITHIELLPLLSRAINPPPVSAPLLAQQDSLWIGNNDISITQSDVLETGLNDPSIRKSIFSQKKIAINHSSEIGFDKLAEIDARLVESYASEIGLFDANALERSVGNKTATQIASNELDIFHYRNSKEQPDI